MMNPPVKHKQAQGVDAVLSELRIYRFAARWPHLPVYFVFLVLLWVRIHPASLCICILHTDSSIHSINLQINLQTYERNIAIPYSSNLRTITHTVFLDKIYVEVITHTVFLDEIYVEVISQRVIL